MESTWLNEEFPIPSWPKNELNPILIPSELSRFTSLVAVNWFQKINLGNCFFPTAFTSIYYLYMYKYPRRNTVAQVELEIKACYTVSSQHCGSQMNLFFFLVLLLQLLIYYTAVSSILPSKNNDENVKQPTGSSESHHYQQKKFLMMLSLQTLLLSFV